jgi:hypothetical protein
LKCRTSELLTQHGPELRIYPSDDVSQWPEELQDRIQRGITGATESGGD